MYLCARWLKGTSSPAAYRAFVRGIGKNFFLITVLCEIRRAFLEGNEDTAAA